MKPHQDLAGAGIARGDRITSPRRACCLSGKTRLLPSAGYGCTTCIGNAGDLRPEFNEAIVGNDIVAAAGAVRQSRNFEARIHANIRANFLASPPLVVAYAIAGTVLKDLATEPVGQGKDGPVYLKDIWPTSAEIGALPMQYARDPATFQRLYSNLGADNPLWQNIKGRFQARCTTGRSRPISPNRRSSAATSAWARAPRKT